MMFNCLEEKTEKLVFETLKGICQDNQWTNLAADIERGMEDCLTNQIASTLEISDTSEELDANLKSVKDNLVLYLKEDVEFIFKYWDKLSASRDDCFVNSYNGNIEIRNNSGKLYTDISSFEKLFEKQTFKRAIITAPAGYGKSTFVHEMVREWVNFSNRSTKFKLIFLLRLGEIKNEETAKFTLKDLFEKCLMKNDAATLLSMLDQKLCSDILFIFDGFDELNQCLISNELMDIILGKSAMKPFVVVKSRREKRFEKIKGECNLYFELKGFTEKGVYQQVMKFHSESLFHKLERDILKVPLFCTLVCIVQQNSEVCIDNHCILIDKTLQYLIGRYEMAQTNFSNDEKFQLFFQLGRIALPQVRQLRSYIENSSFYHLSCATFDDYTMPQSTINTAINANIIMPSSSNYEIHFPHQMFAEYFAAFYLSQSDNCKVDHILPSGNAFRFENNSCCLTNSWLVYFLSHFNETFKLDLWKLLGTCKSESISVPLFVEYYSLPAMKIAATNLLFDKTMPASLVQCATGKFFVQAKILVGNVILETNIEFKNLSNIKELILEDCDINISCAELLKNFKHTTFITFRLCNILRANNSAEYDFENNTLTSIVVENCRTEDIFFFRTMFDLCKSLKTIDVDDEIVCIDWIGYLNISRSTKANLVLKNCGVEINFTDYHSLQVFLQDYNDDKFEHCVLHIAFN